MIIDPEIKAFIPPISVEEYKLLEESLITEGCRDALVTWNDILLDGHNRYEICQKHKINFNTIPMEFENKSEALIWVGKNQLGRRNLIPYQRIEITLKLEPLITEKMRIKKVTAGKLYHEGSTKEAQEVVQISAQPLEPLIASPTQTKQISETREVIANLAGVSHGTMDKAKVIIEKADEATKARLRTGETSINKAFNDIRKQESKQQQDNKPASEMPRGLYNVIYADPPWQYDNSITSWGPASLHYKTLPLDEIMQLEDITGTSINSVIDKNAVLFMWVTNPFLQDAFKVIEAWGFEYKTNIVWVKTNLKKPGSGFYVRGRHELLFICAKGSFVPDMTGKSPIGSVIEADIQEHSQKPKIVYEIIENLYPDCKYLELFARNPEKRNNWTYWGDEIG